MYINGKWYTEPQVVAYVKELESKISELESKHRNECRQIARYEDELRELEWILEIARNEVHRPYQQYKYRFEFELEKVIKSNRSVYHKEEKEDGETGDEKP